ncbi:MAG: hypothetical protein CMJ75_10710 [Planctomycetaceae bacterium]|nr:hypothetical protein [Planctomycetaceae bacterium]
MFPRRFGLVGVVSVLGIVASAQSPRSSDSTTAARPPIAGPVTPGVAQLPYSPTQPAVVRDGALQAKLNATGQPTALSALQVFEQTELIGAVGNEQILAGDVLPMVEQEIRRLMQKMPANQRAAVTPAELATVRKALMQRMLQPIIRNKLLYVDFLRDGAQNAGAQIDEQLNQINSRVDAEFEKSQVPHLMKTVKATSRAELETSLRRLGSSLKGQQQLFREQVMGMQMRQRYVTNNPEISLDQLLERYQENIDDYQVQPKVRWEKLTVLLERYPSRDAAYNDLVDMGNRVFFGASFSEIAKLRSQGVNAKEGGYHGWTNQGSLVSSVIDEALFTLPVDQLSPILEDQSGFHIVRILERTERSRVRFRDAQEQIKKDLQEEQQQKEWEGYLARLQKEIPVWTVFDKTTRSAQKPPTVPATPR